MIYFGAFPFEFVQNDGSVPLLHYRYRSPEKGIYFALILCTAENITGHLETKKEAIQSIVELSENDLLNEIGVEGLFFGAQHSPTVPKR